MNIVTFTRALARGFLEHGVGLSRTRLAIRLARTDDITTHTHKTYTYIHISIHTYIHTYITETKSNGIQCTSCICSQHPNAQRFPLTHNPSHTHPLHTHSTYTHPLHTHSAYTHPLHTHSRTHHHDKAVDSAQRRAQYSPHGAGVHLVLTHKTG